MKNTIRNAWRTFYRNKPLFWAVTLVVGWRVALELLHVGALLFTHHAPSVGYAYDWARWDGAWYLDIINDGYRHLNGAQGQENFAFFPMLPILVKGLSLLTFLPPIYAGLLINFVLTIGVAYFVYRIAEELITQTHSKIDKQNTGILSVLLLVIYPSSLFFAAFYAEPILIFGISGAIFFALQKKYWWAIVFAIVATASKSLGLVALPTIAAIMFDQWYKDRKPLNELIKRWFIAALSVGGLLAYMLYLWINFGQPLLFYTAQKAWGRSTGSFFLIDIWQKYYAHLFDPQYFGWPYTYVLMIFALAMPLVVFILGVRAIMKYRILWPLVMAIVAVGIPVSSGVMESFNRYMLVCVPLVPFLALWLAGKKWWARAAVLMAQTILLIYFTVAFLGPGKFAG